MRAALRRLGQVLSVLLQLVWLTPVWAASLDPSLQGFRILEQLAPADRQEIVRAVEEASGSAATARTVRVPRPRRLAPRDHLLLHYVARLPTKEILRPPYPVLFRLDSAGALFLPGGVRVLLAGLTEQEAAWRLESEPRLRAWKVVVRRLPPAPEPPLFGAALFAGRGAPLGRTPSLPRSYHLHPGDWLFLTWVGQRRLAVSGHAQVEVGPDGMVLMPGGGPVSVIGQPFGFERAWLERVLRKRHPGMRVTVALGPLHRVRVFVLGEVARPGPYMLRPFARVLDALAAAGGPTGAGSLRDIEVKRGREVVEHLDLYSLLLKGELREDTPLHPGSVVFVPTAGPVVTLSGAVLRPARYELKASTPLGAALTLAGGIKPSADPRRILIQRYRQHGERELLSINLEQPGGSETMLRNGDRVWVARGAPVYHRVVRIAGAVRHPGFYPWVPGLRLNEVLRAQDFAARADRQYVLIRTLHAGPAHAFRQVDWLHPGTTQAVLAAGDAIEVVTTGPDRVTELQHLLRTHGKAGPHGLLPSVRILGPVVFPGRYPLVAQMDLADLLQAAGGAQEPGRVEITIAGPGGHLHWTGPMKAAGHVPLAAGDLVTVVETSVHDAIWARISGAVRRPGLYSLRAPVTVASLVRAAGGLETGAVLANVTQDQADVRARRRAEVQALRRALTPLARPSQRDHSAARAAMTLLSARISGRVRPHRVLTAAIVAGLPVANGEGVRIPWSSQTVRVAGLVFRPGIFRYQKTLSVQRLLRLAGGLEAIADRHHLLLRRADGRVVRAYDRWYWHTRIGPGDVLIAPPRLQDLPLRIRPARVRKLIACSLAP